MRKLDLNIKVDKPTRDSIVIQLMEEVNELLVQLNMPKRYEPEDEAPIVKPRDIAINWIRNMLENAINKPKWSDRHSAFVPTQTANMDVQRSYDKIMTALENHKNGIAEMEDDVFSTFDRKFHQAELRLQRDVNKILVKIDDAINKAKIDDKNDKKKK